MTKIPSYTPEYVRGTNEQGETPIVALSPGTPLCLPIVLSGHDSRTLGTELRRERRSKPHFTLKSANFAPNKIIKSAKTNFLLIACFSLLVLSPSSPYRYALNTT